MNYIVLQPGTKFGRLTVLGRGKTTECKHVTWKCQCQCGSTVEVVSQALRDGRTKSCGCWSKERAETLAAKYTRKQRGEASFNLVVKSAKYGAKIRNLSYELTSEDVRKIVTKPCFYCGRSGTMTTHGKDMYGEFKHVGIDRLDNAIGYVLNNCLPCCSDCNRAKGTLSSDQFLAWVSRVHNHSLNSLSI